MVFNTNLHECKSIKEVYIVDDAVFIKSEKGILENVAQYPKYKAIDIFNGAKWETADIKYLGLPQGDLVRMVRGE